MLQNDTIEALAYDGDAVVDSIVTQYHRPRAIVANPDSIPCKGAGKLHIEEVQLPQYYKEGFFSNNPMYHPEMTPRHHGVPGDPVAYTIAGDDILTVMLLICFLLITTAFAQSRSFMMRQLRSLFYVRKNDSDDMGETKGEMNFQIALVVQSCLLLTLIFFFYSRDNIGRTFILPTEYHMLGVYFSVIVGYLIIKMLLSTWVNLTFFDTRANSMWFHSKLFLKGFEGILLFPFIIVQAYLNLPLSEIGIYYLIVIIFVKILAIYKCYSIFFRKIGYFLQIFLYFCTLEMIPLAILWGSLVIIGNYLKVNI